MSVTGTGVWSFQLRYGDGAAITEAAAELDQLGYSAIWVPDVGGPLFDAIDLLLDATDSLTIASGVLNIYQQEPDAATAWWSGLSDDRRARVLLGIGVSHASFIGDRWQRLRTAVNEFLDARDQGGVPAERRCVAA